MANSDKDIKITPNTGESAKPKIEVVGANNATKTITVNDDGSITFDSTLTVSDLTVSGTTTTLNTATMTVEDKNIVLGSGNGTGEVVDATGITLEGGSGDDITFQYNATDNRMELKHGSSFEPIKTGNITVGNAALESNQFRINNTGGYAQIELGGSSGAFIDMKNPFSDDFDARLITDGNGLDLIMSGAGRDIRLMTNGTERFKVEDTLVTSSVGINVTGDLKVGGGDLFVDDSAGRVGIGTTSPAANLHVDRGSTSTASITFGASAGQIFQNENSEFAFGLHNGSPYPLYIQGRTNSDTARQMVLNPLGGNVGIGAIDADDAPLHIKSTTTSLDNLLLLENNGGSGTPGVGIKMFSNVGTQNYLEILHDAFGATNFKTVNGSDTYNKQVHLQSDGDVSFEAGNVAIGHASPTMALDVKGDVFIGNSDETTTLSGSGDLTIQGDTALATFKADNGSSGDQIAGIRVFADSFRSAGMMVGDYNNANGAITEDWLFGRQYASANKAGIFAAPENGGDEYITVNSDSQKAVKIAGDNDDIDFIIHGSSGEYLRAVASTGKVGIGTASPDELLEIMNGSLKITREETDDPAGSGVTEDTVLLDITGGLRWTFSKSFDDPNPVPIGTTTDNDIRIMRYNQTHAQFYWNRTHLTKDVGIGTSNPNQKLTVEGTMSLKEQASANADTAAYGQLWVKSDSPNNLYFTNDAGNDVQITDGSSLAGGGGGGGVSVIGGLTDISMDITNFVDGFLLQTNSDGSAPTTGTLNNATGNIGIGKDVLKTITSADYNVAIGYQAGDSVTTGNRNIMIGEFAGEAVDTGTDNVIIGARAGRAIHDRGGAVMIARGAGENAQSSGVVFIGENAGSEATGDQFGYNIAIGHDSGEYGANSNYGLMIGKSAGKGDSSNTSSPNQMTAVGHFAMENITTGDDNSAFGYQAMQNITTGSDNIAVGSEALNDVTTGDRNIAIGYRAADGFDTESDNIAIGFNALGGSIAGAEYNVFIGNNAGDSHTSGDNNVAIGHDAFTGGSGMMNVCIGSSAGKVMTNNNQQTLVGFEAGKSFSGTNAKLNTAIGYQAMGGGTISPNQNTALGAAALFNVNGISRNNIGIGYQAGVNQTAGSGNVIIGSGVDVPTTNGDRQLIIAGNDGSTTTTWITGTSAGHVSLGNFTFDADQTVGSSQDNFVLTYDDSAGTIGLEAASGGSTSPAGSDGQIQYNNSGSFGGDADLVFDDSNNRLILGSLATQHDFEQKFVIRGTDAGMLIEKHDDSANGGPGIFLYRYSASVADGDLIGQVVFRGEGSTGNPSSYITLRTEIEDTTEGTKDAAFIVRGLINNSQTDIAEFHAAGFTLSQGTFNGNVGTSTYKPAVYMDSGNVNITLSEATIPFDTEVLDPAGNASSTTDGHIRLAAGGYYRISYSIPINDDGSSGSDRTRIFVDMQTDDNNSFSSPTTVAQSRAQVYTREASGGSGLATSFIYEHTANDYIRLRIDAQQNTDISTETNECQISIEYLGPA